MLKSSTGRLQCKADKSNSYFLSRCLEEACWNPLITLESLVFTFRVRTTLPVVSSSASCPPLSLIPGLDMRKIRQNVQANILFVRIHWIYPNNFGENFYVFIQNFPVIFSAPSGCPEEKFTFCPKKVFNAVWNLDCWHCMSHEALDDERTTGLQAHITAPFILHRTWNVLLTAVILDCATVWAEPRSNLAMFVTVYAPGLFFVTVGSNCFVTHWERSTNAVP